MVGLKERKVEEVEEVERGSGRRGEGGKRRTQG